jgi:hypothetical protein
VIEDDIVMKLRVSTVADSAANVYETMTTAADEIERLRDELSERKREFDSSKAASGDRQLQSSYTVLESDEDTEKLKKLVSELIPFMLEDVKQGLSIGVKPSDSECCGDQSEPCDDCQWYLQSESWRKRIESNEFDWVLNQGQDLQES